MKGHRPPRPTGSSRESLFMQWVYDQLTERMIINSSNTVKVKKTTRGITLQAAAPKGSGQSTGSFKGTWDADTQYDVQDQVIFQSANVAGTFVVISAPPIGTPPDTGSPYFVALPTPSPGVWG